LDDLDGSLQPNQLLHAAMNVAYAHLDWTPTLTFW
jgi:hypothetical protein